MIEGLVMSLANSRIPAEVSIALSEHRRRNGGPELRVRSIRVEQDGLVVVEVVGR